MVMSGLEDRHRRSTPFHLHSSRPWRERHFVGDGRGRAKDDDDALSGETKAGAGRANIDNATSSRPSRYRSRGRYKSVRAQNTALL